jgi:hypothetical protein
MPFSNSFAAWEMRASKDGPLTRSSLLIRGRHLIGSFWPMTRHSLFMRKRQKVQRFRSWNSTFGRQSPPGCGVGVFSPASRAAVPFPGRPQIFRPTLQQPEWHVWVGFFFSFCASLLARFVTGRRWLRGRSVLPPVEGKRPVPHRKLIARLEAVVGVSQQDQAQLTSMPAPSRLWPMVNTCCATETRQLDTLS